AGSYAADPHQNRTRPRSPHVSKPRSVAARQQAEAPAGRFSVARTALCAVLVVAGIAYVAYYLTAVDDGTPKVLADLGDWKLLIGFGLVFLGLVLAAHPGTPLGQGR